MLFIYSRSSIVLSAFILKVLSMNLTNGISSLTKLAISFFTMSIDLYLTPLDAEDKQ